MIVDRIITKKKPLDIIITDIRLLTVPQYINNKNIIPAVDRWWWLSSPYEINRFVECVSDDGEVFRTDVHYTDGGVRPLLVGDFEPLFRGDKFELANYTWTVLSRYSALCDHSVGRTYFIGWDKEDANSYNKSNVKFWVENWAEKNNIIKCSNDLERLLCH